MILYMCTETKTPALGSEPTRLCTPEHSGRSAPLSPEEKKKKKKKGCDGKINTAGG